MKTAEQKRLKESETEIQEKAATVYHVGMKRASIAISSEPQRDSIDEIVCEGTFSPIVKTDKAAINENLRDTLIVLDSESSQKDAVPEDVKEPQQTQSTQDSKSENQTLSQNSTEKPKGSTLSKSRRITQSTMAHSN